MDAASCSMNWKSNRKDRTFSKEARPHRETRRDNPAYIHNRLCISCDLFDSPDCEKY